VARRGTRGLHIGMRCNRNHSRAIARDMVGWRAQGHARAHASAQAHVGGRPQLRGRELLVSTPQNSVALVRGGGSVGVDSRTTETVTVTWAAVMSLRLSLLRGGCRRETLRVATTSRQVLELGSKTVTSLEGVRSLTADTGRLCSSFSESIGGARAAVPPSAALVATTGMDCYCSKRVVGLVRC
jgi:hypothetical protein